VETDGGAGTAGGHWDDECLREEVMTGYLSSNNIFSRITVGGLEDLGYEVDYNAAEPFDASNLGTCKASYCSNRRLVGNLRRGNIFDRKRAKKAFQKAKKPISDEGKIDMRKYAAKEMKRLRSVEHDIPEGEIFVGGEMLIVVYLEDGEIYSEDLKWDSVKNYAD